MSAIPSPTQAEFSTASLLVKPSAEATAPRPTNLTNDQLAATSRLGKLAPLAFARHGIALLIGVAVTLAWQTYGDAAKHMIASAASSQDQQQFNAISLDLDAMRQGISGLATSIATNQEQLTRSVGQLTAGQEQMTREIGKLQAVKHYLLYKNSDPPPRQASAPKPILRPSQASTAVTPAKNP
jgi:uncharacterized protein HemX